jgi:hypothetical protein
VKAGDRVMVFAAWSSWRGRRGTVVEARPLWVRLDGDDKPLAMSAREACVIPEQSTRDLGGWAE